MRRSILIVEDDPFIAMDLQDTFEDAGYEVLGPVASVKPGLEILNENQPDFAMLDYNLGNETSLPIAKELKDADIPYAFLSGQMESAIAAGIEITRTIIAKPYNPDILVNQIEQLMRA